MTKKAKVYTGGTCMIGTAGPEIESAIARDSIQMLQIRGGDELVFGRGTKGYEVRQTHINNLLNSRHEWLMLLDTDMVFPAGALETLRSRGLPFISGLYMRRHYAPIAPIWFEPGNSFPMVPWHKPIEQNQLYKIGASGWGCMLIHREVIEKTMQLLHGEWAILEDDMDVWPYSLPEIMAALRALRTLADSKPPMSTLYPALDSWLKVLEAQIRPLRGQVGDIVGSDIRFPFYARAAGFQLYGDPTVRCFHVLEFPLGCEDYDQDDKGGLQATVASMVKRERARQANALKAVRL